MTLQQILDSIHTSEYELGSNEKVLVKIEDLALLRTMYLESERERKLLDKQAEDFKDRYEFCKTALEIERSKSNHPTLETYA
jgi:hypothetical protein